MVVPKTDYRLIIRIPCDPAHLPEGILEEKLMPPQEWMNIKDELKDQYSNENYKEFQLKFNEIAEEDGRKEIILSVPLENIGYLKDKAHAIVNGIYATLKKHNIDEKYVEVKQMLYNPAQKFTLEKIIKFFDQPPNEAVKNNHN